MTDNEIIKAFEICNTREDCGGCPLSKDDPCPSEFQLSMMILDLINRQQAEIEKLGKASGLLKYVSEAVHHTSVGDVDFVSKEAKDKAIKELIDRLCNIQTIKAEAIKEFAEKVKTNKRKLFNYIYSNRGFDEQIDNLVKEMVGEE